MTHSISDRAREMLADEVEFMGQKRPDFDDGDFHVVNASIAIRAITKALTATSDHHLLRELHASYIAGGGDMALAARVERFLEGHGTAVSERVAVVQWLRWKANRSFPRTAARYNRDADQIEAGVHLGGGDAG